MMDWFADTFRDNTGLEHEELLKVFFFVMKAVSAIAFVFVLGYLSATRSFDRPIVLILLLASVVDLVPEAITVRNLAHLPERAMKAEKTQLALKAVAYLLLTASITSVAPDPFTAYVTFTIVWLLSFLIEESALVLVPSRKDR